MESVRRQRGQHAAVRNLVGVDGRVFHDGGYQRKTGHQADHNGIPERTGGGNQSLTHRISRLSGGRRDWGAEPIPDSLENNPLAIPYRMAIMIPVPTSPPAAAPGVNARRQIVTMAGMM